MAVERAARPEAPFETVIIDEADVVMAMDYREKPDVGVQFHRESILIEHDKPMIRNVLTTVEWWTDER